MWGYNQYGVLRLKDLTGCTFSCDPQVGTFDDNGTFVASSTPASGNLYATYNGITATQHITIKRMPLVGDVNDDDEVNIDDVITIIDIIMGSVPSSPAADVNGDGNVNITDVTDLIDIILEQ